jgi:uncharacterized protein YjdB
MTFRAKCNLLLTCSFLLVLPGASAQTQNLTVAVLVNSQNTSGYNTSLSTPGEFQRFAERYLLHLQVPYEIFDVSAGSPPADLSSRQLIISGHSHLLPPADWIAAITGAVNGGTGFVNLDSDIAIGTQAHITSIFGATGASAGTAATQISIPAAVAPGGATPHYIDALQRKLDGGGLVYPFHAGTDGVTRSATSTLLQTTKGTVIAQLGNDPLIRAVTYGAGRAVNFGTMDYLHADRFGFTMGLDDLFWRSLVWAARKPFVLRGYPRFWAVQMDDTKVGWGARVVDLYDTSLTGQAGVDGTGGPWKVTGYVYTDNLAKGTADRTSVIADIKAGKLEITPHSFGDINCGNMYWNGCLSGALTDAQWQTNMSAIDTWKLGNGGNDTIPSFSRSLVAHFWDLSNNTGFDLWNHFGFRYITSIQKAGFQSTLNNNGAERLPVLPYWNYEIPPKVVPDPNFPTETYPFFFADDYTVNSRSGLQPQTFFLFASQYFDTTKYSRPDFEWPSASATPSPTAASSTAQLEQYTWRFWSGLSPVQLFTHDSLNYEFSNIQDRQTVIAQGSQWLNTNGVHHIFMDDLGDYIYARSKSNLTRATFDGSQVTYTFVGRAANADGSLIPTQLLLFQGDSEGAWQAIPGFSSGLQVSRSLPPTVQSVNPSSGITTGNTTVTITGSGFTPDSTVFFGQNSAASVVFNSNSSLQVTTPPGLPEAVDVKVINANGNAILPGGFTYVSPPRVLVAALNFNEGSGTTVSDLSGFGNNGTISGATWNATGKFGKALSFNGTNSIVTINDSASLDLTNGMTLEAWVNPTTVSGWRNVMLKEQSGGLIYGMYANTDTNQPSGHIFLASELNVRGTSTLPANTWSHLALTYNGVIMRLYVNGVEVANKSATGNIAVSNGVLHIGGNSIWGEYFAGSIDEIRIFNQPSTATQIQSDMNTAILPVPQNGLTVAPSSFSLTAFGATQALTVTATFADGSTQNVTSNASTTYTSDNTAVATVSTVGLVKAFSNGTAHITATYGGFSAIATATVTNIQPPTLTGVTLAPVSFTLAPGATQQLTATATYSNGATQDVTSNAGTTYGSDKTTVATVNATGRVTAVASGSATIQVSYGGFSATSAATVNSGLIAAFNFSEGTGTTFKDTSGNNNNGTITGATWSAAGKYGNALSFNGTNNYLTVNDSASLDFTTGMTLEAWVNPSATGSLWRTVIMKEQSGGLVYALYGNTDTNRPSGHAFTSSEFDTRGTAAVATNTWTHLAVTYDGSTLRIFVNGVEASNKAVTGNIKTSTGALRIGGNTIWGEYFAGLIDEVRLYNRPLSATAIQTDMNTPIASVAQTGLTVAPANFTLTAFGATQQLTVTANFADGSSQNVTSNASTTYSSTNTAVATVNATGLVKVFSNGSSTITASYGGFSGNATVTASNIQPPVLTGVTLAPASFSLAPGGTRQLTATATYSDGSTQDVTNSGGTTYNSDKTSVATVNTTGLVTAVAAGTANVGVSYSGFSSSSVATVTNGLVAAYSFNAGSGTTVADASGNGNTGTITGATWSAAGKYGNALSFNGTNNFVTVNESGSLDLTGAMTLEAWVNPSALGSTWRCVLLKEQSGGLIYALYANTDTNRPSGHVYISSEFDTRGTAALATNTWTHLAVTYDGTTLRMFVNGVEASNKVVGGNIKTSTGALRIGGNSVWGEYFSGLIDEVRVYNRALTAAQIQADMSSPVTP